MASFPCLALNVFFFFNSLALRSKSTKKRHYRETICLTLVTDEFATDLKILLDIRPGILAKIQIIIQSIYLLVIMNLSFTK